MNCTVEYISFSAHADFVGTAGFIDKLKPPNIVLVHGEKNEMGRLKNALLKKSKDRVYQPSIHTPANMEELTFEFKGEKMAKAIGTLATEAPGHEKTITGLLVEYDSNTHVMSAQDLMDYTQLVPSTIAQKQHLPFHQPFHVFTQFITQLYDDVEALENVNLANVQEENETTMENKSETAAMKSEAAKVATTQAVCIAKVVTVFHQPPDRLVMEWMASPLADMIADSGKISNIEYNVLIG